MYLCIRTASDKYISENHSIKWEQMHFINLSKDIIKQEFQDFFNSILRSRNFNIIEVFYANTALGSW